MFATRGLDPHLWGSQLIAFSINCPWQRHFLKSEDIVLAAWRWCPSFSPVVRELFSFGFPKLDVELPGHGEGTPRRKWCIRRAGTEGDRIHTGT